MAAWRSPGGRRLRTPAVVATALAGVLALSGPVPAPAVGQSRKPRLTAFASCDALVSYARRNARRTQGRTGVPTRAVTPLPQVLVAPSVGGQEDVALGAPAAPSGRAPAADAPAFSGTNVQEAGVDEPDIVKTDGRRVVAIAGGALQVLDVTGAAPRVVGSLALEGSGHQILVRGDRALVMGTTGGAGILPDAIAPGPRARAASIAPSATTLLTEVDLSDPAAPAVRRTLTLDGSLVDARLTGGTARVVVGSSPEPVALPALRRAGVRTWVPRTVLRSRLTNRTIRRSVVPCDDVRRPRAFSGLDLLTVLTIDLDRGLFSVDRDAILAGAQTVYASPRSLYVASQRFVGAVEAGRSVPEGMRTEIHRFDASDDDTTTYRSSGSVTGFVLNQYALSEHEGFLRVASTDQPQFFADGSRTEGQSYVTVLRADGATLAPVGRAGGLGRGERIYAVRFLGDKGYVVTFRQVDPLYTLDLSRPSDPRVLGELKILGYSAYLHPVSDDLLLGVGQDATAQGRVQGTQLSVFDVSDLRRPRRTAQADLGLGSSSDAEFDPHAFLFWKPSDLAVIPLSVFGAQGEPGFTGAVGFRVARDALGEAGRVAHPRATANGPAPPVGRSLVIGDRLYTLSYAGLAASRLDTLQAVGFAPFAAP